MKVFHRIEDAKGLTAPAVTLGNFDGVHVGHQALIAQARALGEAVVFTFEPHPAKVLQPEMAPRLITPTARKLELFESLGVAAVLVQPFTLAYAATPPQAFEAALFHTLGARHVVVGADFTYGKKRSGTVDTLRAAATAKGAEIHVVPPVTVDGVVVSSTKIRELLLAGRVKPAARLLGRPYDLDGKVVRGKQRGREIGFPTANLETAQELEPSIGIYAVRVRVDGQGPWLPGAASVGFNPTFGDTELTVEVFLIDFDGDLYDRILRVQFIERLRPEHRFDSVEALVAQMHQDVAQARQILTRAP
jgi:riboflavin kinase/FMN adenylyltransferase